MKPSDLLLIKSTMCSEWSQPSRPSDASSAPTRHMIAMVSGGTVGGGLGGALGGIGGISQVHECVPAGCTRRSIASQLHGSVLQAILGLAVIGVNAASPKRRFDWAAHNHIMTVGVMCASILKYCA